jgi:DNA (cytosine-5)-methyltransferase 1
MHGLTVIDFFCGAGGFSEGFRQKKFKIIKGYDNWQPAINTYNHNFGTDSKVKNILDFKNKIDEIENLPETDVIIGSPPCVSFSSSNKSGKADKSLGLELIKCFLRIVAVKKHQKNSILKAWFMENVANSKKYLEEYYTFEDLNLTEWAKENYLNPKSEALRLLENTTIINSADYGSYQARKRAVSGEIIFKRSFTIPKKSHSNKSIEKFKQWHSLKELLNKMPIPNSQNKHNVVVDPIYPSIKLNSQDLTDHFYDSGLYKSEWKQARELKINHYCMGKMSYPENLDKPSRTITATKSGTSREALVYKSEYNRKGDGEYRTPTIREVASIMGFPFTYQFLGSINSKWRLVGNAVCPSVSRALASEVLTQLKIKHSNRLKLIKKSNIENVNNLNTFKEKIFDKQPKRNKYSRFRRHPLKEGNMTVTLSNYDIENNTKTLDYWSTSIQYGTGVNFKNQKVEDGYYKIIEPTIAKLKEGKKYIKIINNGFTDKIGSSEELQKYYELQVSNGSILEPTELVEEVNKIINQITFEQIDFEQNEEVIFKHKRKVPLKQLFALYAINKISSIANKKNYE